MSVKNYKQFINENSNSALNNNTVKTHTWLSGGKEHSFKYSVGRDVFTRLYTTTLLGGEFSNTHGEGLTEEDAVQSLKIRLLQLRNKRDKKV